ncbi:MAG: RluA family pseudouridine synthase [Proteobacteria bacterium]|jgi:tRNA pseudouridine65 synthase|nr:RluA family pseudouridine synthase [Pseudomonadota bacterium]
MSQFPEIPFHNKVEILYEDERFIVIDKPTGLLSHPNQKNEIHESVVQAEYDFKYECYRIGTWKFFLLHRIDKETSGCLLFTKDPDAVKKLKADFENHEVHKEYLALLTGFVRKETAWKDHLVKKPGKVFIDQRLKANAITKVRPLEIFSKERMTFVSFLPQTGRTHQLRVQSQTRHCGILGDRQYGDFNRNKQAKQKWNVGRMMLHASELRFSDPISKKKIRVSCPLPEEFETMLDQLREKK